MIPTRGSTFLAADAPLKTADVTLLGVPFDGTSSFRSGSRFGPGAVRMWSDVLESYSPALDLDLEDLNLCDLGDLDIPVSEWPKVNQAVAEAVESILTAGSIPVLIGGEHLISLSAVRALAPRYPDMRVIHVDAHLDLRDRYQGLADSHATVMRRIAEMLGPDRLVQWGMRSGTRQEWEWAAANGTITGTAAEVAERTEGRPVYLSLDLDVFDPSVMPETGTPEPGGMSFMEVHLLLKELAGQRLVGADVVEYCPSGIPGGPSGAVAAKILREIILVVHAGIK